MKKAIIGVFVILILICGGILIFKIKGGEAVSNKDTYLTMLSHSLYWTGEEAQIISRITNYKGEIINATCYADALYPNKTSFISSALMAQSGETHFHNFTTPPATGVYQYTATCFYDGGNKSVMNSFQVSPALNFQRVLNDTIVQGNLELQNNLSSIKDDTEYIRNNMNSNDSANFNSIISRLDSLANFCGDNYTSGSVLCQWVNETRDRVTSINNTVTIGITNLQNNITYYYETTTEQITNLTIIVQQFVNQTQNNFVTINNTVNIIQNNTQYIMNQLNITTDDLHITAHSSGNCLNFANWRISAQAKNRYNVILDDSEVNCSIVTNMWGNATLGYDILDMEFKWNHICDTVGNILWTVECLRI